MVDDNAANTAAALAQTSQFTSSLLKCSPVAAAAEANKIMSSLSNCTHAEKTAILKAIIQHPDVTPDAKQMVMDEASKVTKAAKQQRRLDEQQRRKRASNAATKADVSASPSVGWKIYIWGIIIAATAGVISGIIYCAPPTGSSVVNEFPAPTTLGDTIHPTFRPTIIEKYNENGTMPPIELSDASGIVRSSLIGVVGGGGDGGGGDGGGGGGEYI